MLQTKAYLCTLAISHKFRPCGEISSPAAQSEHSAALLQRPSDFVLPELNHEVHTAEWTAFTSLLVTKLTVVYVLDNMNGWNLSHSFNHVLI